LFFASTLSSRKFKLNVHYFFEVEKIVEYLRQEGILEQYLKEARFLATAGGTGGVELSAASSSSSSSSSSFSSSSSSLHGTTLNHSQCSLTCKVEISNACGKPCLGLAVNKYGVKNVESIDLLEQQPLIQNDRILLVGYTAFGAQLLESADDRDRRDAVHMLAFNHLVKSQGSTIWTWLHESRGGAAAVGENHISSVYNPGQRFLKDKSDLEFGLILFSPYLNAEQLRSFVGTLKAFRADRTTQIVGTHTEIWLPISSSHEVCYQGLRGVWNLALEEDHPLHIADKVYRKCCDNSDGRLVSCGTHRKQDSYWKFCFNDLGTEQPTGSAAGENHENYYIYLYL
jgi:hypothetical protein